MCDLTKVEEDALKSWISFKGRGMLGIVPGDAMPCTLREPFVAGMMDLYFLPAALLLPHALDLFQPKTPPSLLLSGM